MMNDSGPPRWAEFLLERLLKTRDRETVAGDLREEYVESIMPRSGRLLADLWYFRQCLSFAQRCVSERGPVGKLIILCSIVTLLCGAWLAVMELILRHAGFPSRVAIALLIALVCAATLLARMLHLGTHRERWFWPAALAFIWIGGSSFLRNARSAHFEGFVFVISLIVVLQGLLMLVTMGRTKNPGQHSSHARATPTRSR
jgi:hypothetical protein